MDEKIDGISFGMEFFALIWQFFELEYPGFNFSFGDSFVGFALIGLSLWVIKVFFTSTPGISARSNNRRPKDKSGVKKVR